ncbi:hypothetical protein HQO27_26360 [Rhodococcus fascians]|nr:hypothetical protein [Rhodococcus fascians]MBY4434308.1 hypothetical protein [Rhodococcus fascians]
MLSFAATLRNPGGIDADIDLYHSDDLEIDWTRFGPSLIEECDFTFVVISKAWGDRWSGKNDPTTGAGAVGEADTLKGMFQSSQREFQRRVKCILLPGITDSLIPQDLRRLSRYYVDPENFDTFQDLLRAVTNQPSIIKPDVSAVPFLPTSIASKTSVSSNNTLRKNPDSLANLKTELRVNRRRHAQLIHADPVAHAQEIEKLEEYIAVLGSLADSVYKSDLD